MSSEDTYTGPKVDQEGKFFGGNQNGNSGALFVAIGLAILGVVLAIFAIVGANGADSRAAKVEKSVTNLGDAHDALVQKVKDNREWAVAMLATKATATDVEAALVVLTAKADQSVVDKLSIELKAAGKTTDGRVTRLASDLLLKADAKAVKRIASKVNKLNKRLTAVEELVAKPAPPPPAAPPPPPKPPAAAPPPPVAQQPAKALPAAAGPGRPEQAAPKLPPPAK